MSDMETTSSGVRFEPRVRNGPPLPDGIRFGGVFYPFMVDCEHVDSDGWHNNGSVLPCHCDERFQVRNPALEWQQQWLNPHGVWRLQCEWQTVDAPRWVAVGVKESE